MSLSDEKRRIIDFVSSEKQRVLRSISDCSSNPDVRGTLDQLSLRVFTLLEESLDSRLDQVIADEGDLVPDIASSTLRTLLTGLQATLALLSSVAEQQNAIPRELYYYTDWFFKCVGSRPPYALRLHSELSTTTIGELLQGFFSAGRHSKYPELTSAFSNSDFVLVQIPVHLAAMEMACDWPLVLHECFHAAETQKRYVRAKFNGLPSNWSTLVEQANNGLPDAQHALRTEEFVADAVATCVCGPGYLWAFLRSYSSITGVVHSTKTHPRLDQRADRLAKQLKVQGFLAQAECGEREIKNVVEASELVSSPDQCPTETADDVQTQYFSEIAVTTEKDFSASISKVTQLTPRELVSEFLKSRPISLPPDHLFSLLAFEPGADNPKVSLILADMLRLAEIRRRFQELGLSG